MILFLDKGFWFIWLYLFVLVLCKGILFVCVGGLGGLWDFLLDMFVFILDILNLFGDLFYEIVFVFVFLILEDCLCKICFEFVKFLLCFFDWFDRGYFFWDCSLLLCFLLCLVLLFEFVIVFLELNEGDLCLFGIDCNFEGVFILIVLFVDFFLFWIVFICMLFFFFVVYVLEFGWFLDVEFVWVGEWDWDDDGE